MNPKIKDLVAIFALMIVISFVINQYIPVDQYPIIERAFYTDKNMSKHYQDMPKTP